MYFSLQLNSHHTFVSNFAKISDRDEFEVIRGNLLSVIVIDHCLLFKSRAYMQIWNLAFSYLQKFGLEEQGSV